MLSIYSTNIALTPKSKTTNTSSNSKTDTIGPNDHVFGYYKKRYPMIVGMIPLLMLALLSYVTTWHFSYGYPEDLWFHLELGFCLFGYSVWLTNEIFAVIKLSNRKMNNSNIYTIATIITLFIICLGAGLTTYG